MLRTEAVVDLAAIRDNVRTLKAKTSAQLLAVVKADAYGHGLLPVARAAVQGGADWLGTAVVGEALQLRAAGIAAPLLAWLWSPGESESVRSAVTSDVDLSVSSPAQLAEVRAAAAATGRTARIHLKVDTGLTRNGCYVEDWPELLALVARAQAGEEIQVVGVWSHFAYADEPGHPTIAKQIAAFEEALRAAERAGVQPQIRHLANSAATLTLPAAHFDMVRPGVAVYGLSPVPSLGTFGLTPAMTLRATVALAKRVRAGEGVSYGHTYETTEDTTVALVPLGYADGVPRAAGNLGPVSINGKRFTVSGRVCMDQFVVDVGDQPVAAGDSAVLFGPGSEGEPTAQEWADAVGTIHYEIVTRIGPRVERSYLGEQ